MDVRWLPYSSFGQEIKLLILRILRERDNASSTHDAFSLEKEQMISIEVLCFSRIQIECYWKSLAEGPLWQGLFLPPSKGWVLAGTQVSEEPDLSLLLSCSVALSFYFPVGKAKRRINISVNACVGYCTGSVLMKTWRGSYSHFYKGGKRTLVANRWPQVTKLEWPTWDWEEFMACD